MTEIELMTTILGKTDIDSVILQFHLDNAKQAILNYTGDKSIEDIPNYMNVVVELAIYYYKNMLNHGIVQESEGSVSKTYRNEEMPKNILLKLPLPKVRVF